MDVSSEMPLDDPILIEAQKLPTDIRRLVVGVNNPSNIDTLIEHGDVLKLSTSDYRHIVPETIDNIITGFLVLNPKTKEVARIRLEPGGLGLGYSLKHSNYASDCFFVFQNPYLGLQLFLKIYLLDGVLAPIVISPSLDFDKAWKWLPSKEFVLVFSDYDLEKKRHLLAFNPKVVSEAAVQPYKYDLIELLLYKNRSKPLNTQLFPSVAINVRTSVVAGPHSWHFLPNSGLALSVNLQIYKVITRKRAYRYIGTIHTQDKQVVFRATSKKEFYPQVKNTCERAGIHFYCCPSIKNNLADIACALSPSLEFKKYKTKLTKDKIFLPNSIITPKKIIHTGLGVPGEAASKVVYRSTPDLTPQTRGQLNQLALFFAICCAVGRAVYYGKRVNVFVIGEYQEHWGKFFKNLSINTPKSSIPWRGWWPAFYPKFELDSVGGKGTKIYFGNELQSLVSLYLEPGILLGVTDEIFPLYPDKWLGSAMCLWLQFCLKHKTEWTEIRKKDAAYFDFYLDNFCKMFKIPEEDKNYILLNVKKAIRSKKVEFATAITHQLIQEGELSEKDLTRVSINQFLVPVEKLNAALRKRGLAEIFWENHQGSLRIYSGPVSRCPLNVTKALDAPI